ncbi:MAG: carboxypeptidase-like regulatory domain-containing protein [Bacteroidota bacterium]
MAGPEPQSRLIEKDYFYGGARLRGVVMDVTGEPLIGASVLIASTTRGTVTDLEGQFSLEVPVEEYELVVSYTGFTTFTLPHLRGGTLGTPLAISMKENAAYLDQVVVVGYGTSLKREMTGSVASVSALDSSPVFVRGLSSQAAGVQVTNAGPLPKTYANNLQTNLLPPPTVRESFADYAAFIPSLRTDAAGRAVFDVTFPDDITAWNTYAVGQDRRRRVGFTQARTTAFLPLQAQLYLPRFLVEGDQSEAATLAINRTGTDRNVRLQFSGTNLRARTQDAGLSSSLATDYPITAPSDADSLTYAFSLQTLDGEPASDGEERQIPVYPRGSEVISGELLLLTDSTQALPAGFVRPERGPVVLRLLGNRLEQLLKDIDHIVDYPYACSEQTASRLIGLLALRDIRRAEGKPFYRGAEIHKMIARLRKLQRPNGGLGWWPEAEKSSPWISLHAYRALAAATAAGFPGPDLTPLRRYLLASAAELPRPDQLQIALALAEDGFPPTHEEIIRLDTSHAPTDFELLAVNRLRQLRGDTVDVQRLLDSSGRHAVMGRYWGKRRFRFYRQPLDDRLACGLLARRILSAAGRDTAATETVNYLLGQTPTRTRPGVEPLLGTNTLESAHLVADLLPYLLEDEKRIAPPSVVLTSTEERVEVTDFPYATSVPPEKLADFRLERAGSGPLPVSLHQRWFATEPEARASGFRLETELMDARSRPLPYLTKGVTAYLETTVTVAADADYVLIEIPIPAGCSYANRAEQRGPFAVHRAYRRDLVAIFCDRLPAGTYTYRVALAPRFAGTYSLNPARAEMQYVPAVYGNGMVREVRTE